MGEKAANDRGVLPRYIRMWVIATYGTDGFEKFKAALSPEAARMITQPVPHEWYNVKLMHEVYASINNLFGKDDKDVLFSLGLFVADHSVQGFLQYLVHLVSAKNVIPRIGAIWRRYHDTGTAEGKVTSEKGGEKEGTLTIKGYDAGQEFCELMRGYIYGFMKLTGAEQIEVKKENCIHKSGEVCSWNISWLE